MDPVLIQRRRQIQEKHRRLERERHEREKAERQAKREEALLRQKEKEASPQASPSVAKAGLPKTVNWRLSQESPASSVSLSQSIQKHPPTKKLPAASRRITFDDSSSSEDEDLVALSRQLTAKRRQKEDAEKKRSAAVSAPVASTAAAAVAEVRHNPWGDADDSESDIDLMEIARARTKKISQRTGDSNPPAPPAEMRPSQRTGDSTNPPAPAAEMRPSSGTKSSDTTSSSSGRRRARNPLALMAEERAQAQQVLFPKPKRDSDSDDLWDDGDDDLPPAKLPASSEKTTPAGGKKRPRQPKASSDKKPKVKEPGDAKEGEEGQDVHAALQARPDKKRAALPIDDVEEDLGEEPQALSQELKPDFEDPKFGPYEFEPLSLGKGVHEVPASINRYIQNFQQIGIQFMYEKAIMTGKGAILGDEMGLGKTIQVAGLLAAILEKKGNGLDAIELRRRCRVASKHTAKVQAKRDEAMRAGNFAMTFDDPASDLKLPKWAPVLIVVPASVIDNWLKELSTWGHFGVDVYKGSRRESVLENARLGAAEIMLLSHDRFSNDVDALLVVEWKLVVVDEFHLAKNHKTHFAKALRTLRNDIKCAVLGLTGTLIQNKHKELWNLVDIVSEGYLGSWSEFEAEYAGPIKLSLSTESNKEAVERGKHMSSILSLKLKRDLFLERKKKDVLKNQLPEKHQFVVFCDPSPLQKKLYRHILELPDCVLLKQARGPCDCGINQEFFREFRQLRTKDEKIEYQRRRKDSLVLRKDCCYRIPKDPMDAVLWRQLHEDKGLQECKNCPYCIGLPMYTVLNKLSSHAALLQAQYPPDHFGIGSAERKDAEKELEKARAFIPLDILPKLPGESYVRGDGIMDDHSALSGKMQVLGRLLRQIMAKRGRTLLFSASVQALNLIQNFVNANGFSHLRMDGGTASHKRQDLVDKFNKDESIALFLLSMKAMAVGLNITGANYVIIFDVEWNPSWEAQAADRAYRIGQTKDVRVYRLISTGTIEEMKYQRQVYKNQLKDETLKDTSDVSRKEASRLFRGVDGDKTRRGELFGNANLLKFKDGTFMDYGIDKAHSRNFGGIRVQRVDVLQERVNSTSTNDTPTIDEDGNMLDELEGLASEEHATDHEEDESDDGNLGGESQVNLDIYENVDVDEPNDDMSHPSKVVKEEDVHAVEARSTSLQPRVLSQPPVFGHHDGTNAEDGNTQTPPPIPPKGNLGDERCDLQKVKMELE